MMMPCHPMCNDITVSGTFSNHHRNSSCCRRRQQIIHLDYCNPSMTVTIRRQPLRSNPFGKKRRWYCRHRHRRIRMIPPPRTMSRNLYPTKRMLTCIRLTPTVLPTTTRQWWWFLLVMYEISFVPFLKTPPLLPLYNSPVKPRR